MQPLLVLVQVGLKLRAWLEDQLPELLRIAHVLQEIEHSAPVEGYEAFFRDEEGRSSFEARFVAACLIWCGRKELELLDAKRSLANAIHAVVKAKSATPIAISRRAQTLAIALEQPFADLAMAGACEQSAIPLRHGFCHSACGPSVRPGAKCLRPTYRSMRDAQTAL